MSNQPVNPDRFNYIDEDPAGDQDSDSFLPPDEPMGAHAFGITAKEERQGETFALRYKHSIPEVFEKRPYQPNDIGQLVQPGDRDIDDTDTETNVVATDRGLNADDNTTLSAEEQAMHSIVEQQ